MSARKEAKEWSISKGLVKGKERFCLYGDGGVGKTTLIATMPRAGVPVLLIDLDKGSKDVDVARLAEPVETLDDLRDVLHSPVLLEPYKAVVIDSATVLDDMARRWVLKNKTNDNDKYVNNIESFGWGKGYTLMFEALQDLFADFDSLNKTMHVGFTAHSTLTEYRNPEGEDYLIRAPRLQQRNQCPLRDRMREWAGHLLYMATEVVVKKDGKTNAKRSGTRMVHSHGVSFWAKSRSLATAPIECQEGDSILWQKLFQGGEKNGS